MSISLNIPTKKSKDLPSLSENTFLRYFNFIALYVAQGIPEGMTLFGIPVWSLATNQLHQFYAPSLTSYV